MVGRRRIKGVGTVVVVVGGGGGRQGMWGSGITLWVNDR